MKRKAVFLDRDGTINADKGHLYKTEDFEFIGRAPEAIALLKEHGFRVFVVTNQSGVARGFYAEEDVRKLHAYINEELKAWGAEIDAFYYCPHHPEAGRGIYRKTCGCRKPGVGMYEQACRDFEIDVSRSWMIGDSFGDMEAGSRFGLRTIMVRTGYGAGLERAGYDLYDHICDDLYAAVQLVLEHEGENGQEAP